MSGEMHRRRRLGGHPTWEEYFYLENEVSRLSVELKDLRLRLEIPEQREDSPMSAADAALDDDRYYEAIK